MVCERCKIVIGNALQELDLKPISISLGEIDFGEYYGENFGIEIKTTLQKKIESYGFELLDTKRTQLIEKIKKACIEFVVNRNNVEQMKLSSFLNNKLHYDYNYLSQLFSSVEGATIERYYILQRTEKVKELLVYDELSLGEIAYQLGYSSAAHLSGQFKKITGLTPSYFRSLKDPRKRNPLDTL